MGRPLPDKEAEPAPRKASPSGSSSSEDADWESDEWVEEESTADWQDATEGRLPRLLDAVECDDLGALRACLDDSLSEIDLLGPEGDSALHTACLYGHLACVRELLSRGASPATPDEDGALPLHDAAAGGHAECCEALLARSPGSAGARDADGDTPLHNAARGNHAHVVRLLLARGAEPLGANERGQRAIQVCSRESEAFKVLAEAEEAAGAQETRGV